MTITNDRVYPNPNKRPKDRNKSRNGEERHTLKAKGKLPKLAKQQNSNLIQQKKKSVTRKDKVSHKERKQKAARNQRKKGNKNKTPLPEIKISGGRKWSPAAADGG